MQYERQVKIDVAQFLGSKYLGTVDISGPQVATIVNAKIEEFDNGERAVAVYFAELQKPFTLNKTNLQSLVEIFQTFDASEWRGPVGLFVDPEVKNSRQQRVGGVRVTRAENIRPQRAKGSAGQMAQPKYDGDPEEHVNGTMNY